MTTLVDAEHRYLHRALVASDGTPTQYTADSGSTTTVVDAALTEADDYWNGALVRWDGGSNAGLWSSVGDFVAATDTLTFDEELPNAVQAGDTFTLLLGGKYASSARVAGLVAGPLADVTGFTVEHAAMQNGEGTGTLRYYSASTSVTWQPPDELVEGALVDVSGLSNGDEVEISGPTASRSQLSKYVLLKRTAAALPVADATDDLSLDLALASLIPRVTGPQAAAGVTLYRPVAIRNAGGGFLYDFFVFCEDPAPGAAATTLSSGIGTAADTLDAASLVGWPASGWVYNSTKLDVRYFYDRSGDSAVILDPSGGHRGFTAAAWDAGDAVEVFPWVDIGLDAAAPGDLFEDPATVETAPSGVSFSCPLTIGTALAIGTLSPAGVACVWMRIEVPAGARPVEGGRVHLKYSLKIPT